MSEDRYSRQRRIEGWDQSRLEKAHVAVLGSGELANFTTALLSALGVGRLTLYGNKKFERYTPGEFMLADLRAGDLKVRGIERSARQINPTINIESYQWDFSRDYLAAILEKPDVIVDTDNNPNQEASVLVHAMLNNIPVVNGSAGLYRGSMSVFHPDGKLSNNTTLDRELLAQKLPYNLMSFLYEKSEAQDPVISSIIAGLLADEVRKIIMPLKTMQVQNADGTLETKTLEPVLEGKIIYDTLSADLVTRTNKLMLDMKQNYNPFKFEPDGTAYIVGAGSLGNVVGVLLAILGPQIGIKNIYIFDNDTAESVNLNRQIMFALYGEDVGKQKSPALAAKLKKINPYINVVGVDSFFNRDGVDKRFRKPTVIFDCVDRYVGMEEADEYSKKNNVPMISGHTDYKEGQAFYSNIYTGQACGNARLNIAENAEIERNPTSCIQQSNPSVIISNWIIGSLMVDLYKHGFSTNGHRPIDKVIKYNSNLAERISVLDTANTACRYKTSGHEKFGKCEFAGSCKYDPK